MGCENSIVNFEVMNHPELNSTFAPPLFTSIKFPVTDNENCHSSGHAFLGYESYFENKSNSYFEHGVTSRRYYETNHSI